MTKSFWKQYEEAVKEEGGGGGIIGKVLIQTGYKVYITGMKEESFFPCLATKEARRVTEKQAALLGAAEGKDPKFGIQIKAFVDESVVNGKPATWQGDRYWNVDSWTSAAKDVVVPSLREHKINLPFEGYARIGFVNDPYKVSLGEAGMTKTDQEGKPKFPTVAYITEVFADQAAAQAAIGVASETAPVTVAASASDSPWGDDDKDGSVWEATQPEVYAALQNDEPVATIAQNFGISPMWVMKVKNNYVPI